MNILLIDNYDSFTYNLVQYLGELGAEVEVVKPAPIASDDNAVNVARRRAKERPGSVFCDQVHDRRTMGAK